MKKLQIEYITGDCLESQTESFKLIPLIVNDVGGWGAGFVLAVSKKWKAPENAYRKWHKDGFYLKGESQISFALGNMQSIVVEPKTAIIEMVAQHKTIHDNPKPIVYSSLALCMEKIGNTCKKMIESEKPVEIHTHRFGSGLAKGSWPLIEELIIELWINNNIPVFIYDIEKV